MTHVAHCPKCRTAVDEAQSESWCVGCGTPLGETITSLLPKVVAQRTAVARELAHGEPKLPISRGERIFRGMLGMGLTFGAVGAAMMVPLAVGAFLSFLRNGTDADDLDFLIVAPFVWIAIAFGLGMTYGGLLAFLARGRSFREVSIARVAAAGAAVGLVPVAVVAVGSLIGGGTLTIDEVLTPLVLFPPISAAIATGTLLLARRAKPELGAGDQPSALRSGYGRGDGLQQCSCPPECR